MNIHTIKPVAEWDKWTASTFPVAHRGPNGLIVTFLVLVGAVVLLKTAKWWRGKLGCIHT